MTKVLLGYVWQVVLFGGALAIVIPEAYKKKKSR